jgi:hypothetical protein
VSVSPRGNRYVVRGAGDGHWTVWVRRFDRPLPIRFADVDMARSYAAARERNERPTAVPSLVPRLTLEHVAACAAPRCPACAPLHHDHGAGLPTAEALRSVALRVLVAQRQPHPSDTDLEEPAHR